MDIQVETIKAFLESVHPYDSLPREELVRVAGSFSRREYPAGTEVYAAGEPIRGLFLIKRGAVEVTDRNGGLVSILGPRNSFGERGLLRDGLAMTTARATEDSVILMLPEGELRRQIEDSPAFARFFNRSRASELRGTDLSAIKVGDLMARSPVTIGPDASVADAARLMRDKHISSLAVTRDGALCGIVTTRDLSSRVLAEGLAGDTPIARVMTPDPVALTPESLGSDILHAMLEHRIGHLPVVQDGQIKGIITQTDLTRFQAVSSAQLVRDVSGCDTAQEMAEVTARIPRLLMQLVAANNAHEVVTRLITDITDTVTRRLLKLAEAELGPAPVPWLWLACGSQGRQEQTGISDQDNCLILDDSATDDDLAYFARFAKIVSDGLDAAGYFYCPGDMMATNPRWCQPLRVWRRYFRGWIDSPVPEAQMLASVMFDLRPIDGTTALFHDLQEETLAAAARDSIFVAHMIANSLKHQPPLGLLRGFATIRSGEHKNHIDMKLNGVVPVADLARVYALEGRLPPVNTRARLEAAEHAGVISVSGARDLIEAYDLIARLRLESQAALVRAGRKPDNFLAPSDLSDFERSHLRDAFVVVRTMQSALGHSRGALR
ncbi:MAG: CBS domain-containing protein [Rhodobacteraceae bacterium HLUCCA12]|nr:MAG: CBS domain-containing protein [Rhodobacteraceae bacterium HLUCCA12]